MDSGTTAVLKCVDLKVSTSSSMDTTIETARYFLTLLQESTENGR